MTRRIICLILSISMALSLSGCGVSAGAVDLTDGITPNKVTNGELSPATAEALLDFSVRLFTISADAEENTILSPVSVLFALAMTANGANDATLSQMEETFGVSIDELNKYLAVYGESLDDSEEYGLNIANSIWFRDDKNRLAVEKDFLQANADFYGADIRKAPFDDSTLRDINNWVKDETDGMIKNILDKIPVEAVMYLINAIAFDAEWMSIYQKSQIRDGMFTKEDGTQQKAEMMYSTEHRYLHDDNAEGFVKYYKNGKFALATLLPNEDMALADYVASLTGEKLQAMLEDESAYEYEVRAAIPKFESEFSVEMSEILHSMGMTDAFDEDNADFSNMATSSAGNIFISRVLHKAFISVDERGTKAGAVTVVEVSDTAALIDESKIKTVHLDRPFVYMIIDTQTNLPLFMGTVTEIK